MTIELIKSILAKIFVTTRHFLRNRIYVNETLILFVYEKQIHQESPARIDYISFENVTDLLDFQHPKYMPAFKEFLERGDRGYLAYLSGKCVHRSWVVHSPHLVHLHPMLPMQLKEGEAFIHYCETSPDARGRNIYPAVLSKVTQDFKSYGSSLMISANEKNSNSIKGIIKAGFVEIERQRIVILLGIKFKKIFKLKTSSFI